VVKNSLTIILTILLAVFGLSSASSGAVITLAWDPPTENEDGTLLEDLAGYKVYYAKVPGVDKQDASIKIPLTDLSDIDYPACTIAGLQLGQQYCFAVTAYDTSNNYSGLSNEVCGVANPIPPPVITSIQINGGAATTASKTVTLNNTATNNPTRYKASEGSDFKGALWLVYKEAPKFILSAGAGTKTVYFKVKNMDGESSVASDTIALEGPAVSSFDINGGAASTTSRKVTLDNTAINSPTYYKASESPDFAGKKWLVYKEAPKFKLSAGAGTKTVYFKVKNGIDESSVASDTITLEGPAISSFDINEGAASTTIRTVTLNNTAINGPTYYKASERPDFVGASWLVYKEAPKFKLSAGAGTKTVYFKVKNGIDESSVASDTIELKGPEVSTFQINSDAATTAIRTVTLNNTAINNPTYYKASESPDFAGKIWLVYKEAPKFTLSASAGTKTVYFKVKNSVGESSAVSDMIELIQ
jgi:hypothetical protein